MIKTISFATVCIALAFTTSATAAEPYPTKPVKVIVPWPPGQATDAATRAVSQHLATSMGQPFIVDNRAGAGGAIGSDAVAKSPPDGYTLLAASTGSVTVNPLISKTPYDFKSFVPAGVIATVPYVLVTSSTFPAKDAPSLIAMLRANPGQYTYASSGNGSIGHLIAELFLSRIDVKSSHVPYKGSGPALIDVMTGRVDFMFDSVTSVLPHVKSGRLKAYGLSSAKRSSTLPDIPSLASVTDLRDFDLYAWIGFMAPAGTPEAALSALNKNIQAAVSSKSVQDQYKTIGVEAAEQGTPADMAKLLDAERTRLGALIRAANIKSE